MTSESILIVSYGDDDHVGLVCSELERLGTPFLVFDTADYGTTAGIGFVVDHGVPQTRLVVRGQEHSGHSFGAVLFRHVRLPQAPHLSDPGARKMAESEMRWTLEGALAAIEPRLWMNHPNANRLARNKLLQLRLAAWLGFALPETLVSADPRAIRERYRAWNGRMVAKLVGGQIVGETIDSQYVIYTTPITADDLVDDGALAACPAIYQNRVAKAYELRVTIVGEVVFACRIQGKAGAGEPVDWRAVGYAGLDIRPHELDSAVSDRCLALTRALGLEVAGLDLIVTPDGEVVFLEINAAGQWAWMQQATGLPIAAAVADRLAEAAQRGGPARRIGGMQTVSRTI